MPPPPERVAADVTRVAALGDVMRVAALGDAPLALAGVRTVLDVPVRDAVAWLVAADELEGARFVDWETHKRMEEMD